ncbi:MAG: helix-turn-helix domain-containing protein [Candidatus Delongbacteria bacterium]
MSRALTPVQPQSVDEIVVEIHRQLGYSVRPPALLTASEVGSVLRIKEATLRNWRSAQRPGLPFTRIGNSPMYRPRDVAAFILSCTEGASQ